MIESNARETARGRVAVLGLLLAALAVAILLAAGEPAHGGLIPTGNSFTVNSAGDQADANLADRACDVDTAATGSQCTLRAAIEEANDTPNVTFGADTINDTVRFNIPGTGVQTISPSSQLPAITDAVTIDGYTQPGASKNTLSKGTNAVLLIELSGANAGGGNGLVVQASDSLVRGLVINSFSRGISMGSAGSSVVSGNTIEGNFIGTDRTGQEDLGNSSDGILVFRTTDSTVGGSSPAARNLISGNGSDGVSFGSQAENNRVEGNLIGTGKDGTTDLGNDASGMSIVGVSTNASHNTVGGATSGANTIAFNGGQGVSVFGSKSVGNRILSNSIFSNAGLGIDLNLGVNGITPNDPGDADTGANNLQNFPVLTSATTTAGSTTIRGKLNSTPNTTFTVQFFSNPPRTDEGKKFLRDKSATTDASGKATFTRSVAAVPAGQAVTATATDPSGNTSKFSAPKTVVAQ